MRVLVTGGAGFIGSHSVEALLAAGAEVVAFDNLSAGKRENLPAHTRLRFVEGDTRERDALCAAMAGCSHVLNLAAQVFVPASIKAPGNSAHHNIVGFANVLDCAREHGIRRVVFASSAAVYGTPQSLPLTEDSPTAPMSPYGLEKLVNEQQGALFETLAALSPLALRYFNVYGPRQDPTSQYAGVISRFTERLLAGKPLTVFGDGLQTRDFVYVGDVARANVAALGGTATGVCNVGTGRSVTLLELIDALAGCIEHTPEVVFGAPQPGDVRHSAMTPARLKAWLNVEAKTPLEDGLARLLSTLR